MVDQATIRTIRKWKLIIKLAIGIVLSLALGGGLIYSGLQQNPNGPFNFQDIYPGVLALVAGLGLTGVVFWLYIRGVIGNYSETSLDDGNGGEEEMTGAESELDLDT
jgi:amino acid transporter